MRVSRLGTGGKWLVIWLLGGSLRLPALLDRDDVVQAAGRVESARPIYWWPENWTLDNYKAILGLRAARVI